MQVMSDNPCPEKFGISRGVREGDLGRRAQAVIEYEPLTLNLVFLFDC